MLHLHPLRQVASLRLRARSGQRLKPQVSEAAQGPVTHAWSSSQPSCAEPSVPIEPARLKGSKVKGSNQAVIWGKAFISSHLDKDPTNVDLNYVHLSKNNFAVSGSRLRGKLLSS